MENGILHVDMNNFYASVETLYAPQYRDVPMAVAGDEKSRHGIILAKNALAKQRGVQTAETIGQALKKCPELKLLPPHHDRYAYFSRRAKAIYCEYTDRVESFGLDECWLDVYGSERLFGDGEQIAQTLRKRIREELGLTVSSTRRALEKMGLHTIGEIARTPLPALRKGLGRMGETLWLYANGRDDSPVRRVDTPEEAKSIGNSVTLPRDITGEEEVRQTLLSLAETVAGRLRAQGVKAGEVQLTIRNKDFEEIQRQCPLEPPACDSQSIYRTALELYHREKKHWAIRLLGIRAGHLTDKNGGQLSFFTGEERRERREKLETAVDALRAKYGKNSVSPALTLNEKHGKGGTGHGTAG